MQFNPDYWRLGGAAGTGALADYVDLRMAPFSARMTNSELLALILIGADVFNLSTGNPNYNRAIAGGADYGVGVLTAGLLRRRLAPPVVVPTTPATQTAPSTNPGLAGVAASGGSAAFDLPMGGF
jgi:hypothetical protein